MESDSSKLEELVERFRVYWRVWPESVYVDGKERQIGFELDLLGTHEPWVKHPEPGCEHCLRVFAALHEIAEWILPKEERPSTYEIEVFDPAIRYSAAHKDRPDVQLTIRILHRNGWDQPVDECEERCLREMKAHLAEIGAYRQSWRKHVRSQGAD